MMMKIQSATPASFKLIDLANAGVAIRENNPTINPTKKVFSPLTSSFPFL